MVDALLARLQARVILVGGKGGVGKSTSAGAIALALADRGQTVHLISTDPAHSLNDLLAGEHCSDRLTVEEFVARPYADAWFARVRPSLVSLLERGTYLDEADARGFLDLSIPGIDEVMAALRLVDLLAGKASHIVVDTAPTGHTIRLLESARILRTWIATGRALADKAGAVASQLLGQFVRFPAEETLDDIERAADNFETQILHQGDFVLVTRAGRAIAEETERLRAELARRGVRVAATITDRASATDTDVFVAPHLTVTTGCAALRTWAARFHEDISPVRSSAAHHLPGNAAAYIAALPARLVWVAGKGGVGKSTCAGALASFLAQTRNVRVVSTDPAGSLSEIFDQPVTRTGTRIGPRLTAVQIDAPAELDGMRRQYRDAVEEVFAELGLESAAQLDRRVIEALFDLAPPGIDEIIALIEILDHIDEYDVTIIDSAPTGHFLRLLEMPEIALQWVHALLRLLLKYHAAASLDALGQDLLAFSKRLRQLRLDLSAPDTTAVFVVTLAEPLVTAETRRLCEALEHAHIPMAALVCNRSDVASARALRAIFSAYLMMRAPDSANVTGAAGLRRFLTEWELIGE